MDERNIANGEFRLRFFRQPAEFLQRHFLIGFVVEVKRLAAAAVIAHHAIENDEGAVFRLFQHRDDIVRHNAFAD